MKSDQLAIDSVLVRRLVKTQFPEWKDLPITPVANGGWDNRTFHLGKTMLVRLPSAAHYASQVEKENKWLPKLAPFLPLAIPAPVAIGEPAEGYPFKWSIFRWLPGESASTAHIDNLSNFAATLADFLIALHAIDTTDGPLPGQHSFYRGGELKNYDREAREAIATLQSKINVDAITTIWEEALKTSWQRKPVWVHGDISAGNLLVQDGRLTAVIDFGQLAVGDPACDLAITWTLFKGESRSVFHATLDLDNATWMRGRAWTLWKALVVAAEFTNPNNTESAKCWRIIDDVIEDFRSKA